MSVSKDQRRGELLKMRLHLTADVILEKSVLIQEKLFATKEFTEAKKVLIYLPINNEVETGSIIDKLLTCGKKVYLPTLRNGQYVICEFKSWNDLEVGRFGILQPKEGLGKQTGLVDVVLIPGLAFTKSGVRVGYGQGVYDQLLSGLPVVKIGLAYELQILDEVEKESHDILMDFVITEKKIYRKKVT